MQLFSDLLIPEVVANFLQRVVVADRHVSGKQLLQSNQTEFSQRKTCKKSKAYPFFSLKATSHCLHGGNKSKVSSIARLQICRISIKVTWKFHSKWSLALKQEQALQKTKRKPVFTVLFSSWCLDPWKLLFSLTPCYQQFQNCYGARKWQHFCSSNMRGCHHCSGNGSFTTAATASVDFPRRSGGNSWVCAEPGTEGSLCQG